MTRGSPVLPKVQAQGPLGHRTLGLATCPHFSEKFFPLLEEPFSQVLISQLWKTLSEDIIKEQPGCELPNQLLRTSHAKKWGKRFGLQTP